MKEEERRYEEAAWCCRAACGNRLGPAAGGPADGGGVPPPGGAAAGGAATGGERSLGAAVTPEDLETLCDLATDYSRYAAEETLREGYLSVRGGFRVGLCGTAVMKDGRTPPCGTRPPPLSASPGSRGGSGGGGAPAVSGRAVSEHPAAVAPGGGKTTLLRDLVRCLSSGGTGRPGLRVSLIDERGGGSDGPGRPQMDVGPRTDVLTPAPRPWASLALRAMNPQVIAVDEITAEADLRAAMQAAGCGVGLLATIHAADAAELTQRPLYRQLLAEKVFRLAVRIRRDEAGRTYEVEELPW
ncbi:MAG: stage III sporulation protein AA [Dysosmobacter welbionis]